MNAYYYSKVVNIQRWLQFKGGYYSKGSYCCYVSACVVIIVQAWVVGVQDQEFV